MTNNKFPNKKDLKVVDRFGNKKIIPDKSVIYTGNIELINKVKTQKRKDHVPPLAAAVLGLNNTVAPFPENLDRFHPWSDIDSQETFLRSKPTCYVIFAKPGTGGYLLGEYMAKKFNCVHICPKNVIVDEIEQNSFTGKCIDFNLRHNNVCKYDIILSIMKQKLKSPAVKHRGYVISGLPLVTTSRKMKYFCKQLHSEESVIFVQDLLYDLILSLSKKKPKKSKKSESRNTSVSSEVDLEVESEIEEEEEEQRSQIEEEIEQPVVLPKYILDPCFGIVFSKNIYNTKKAVLLHQCHELFNLDFNPDIIICVTCLDEDAIMKKSMKYFSYSTTLKPISNNPLLINHNSEIRWPKKYATVIDVDFSSENNVFHRKYNCRLPLNFTFNSTDQICNYKEHILPYIERKIKDFEPKFVVKLDGNGPFHEITKLLLEKLILLPIQPVLVPEPLYLEDPPEDMQEFWKLAEEINIIQSGSITFNRYVSPWFNRCPIELKKRRSIKGSPKFAVSFLRHVYLLSSLDALIKFCGNPRPFLKLEYLEPTCRIIVIGTKLSGKSMISECLSWLFDTPIIRYEAIVDSVKHNKYENFCMSILPTIIPKIEDDRLIKWEKLESDRQSELQAWITLTSNILNKYVALSMEYLQYIEEEISEDVKEERLDLDANLIHELNNFKSQLSFLPILDNLNECLDILQKGELIKYAPDTLAKSIPKPLLPVLGDEDVTATISDYILSNSLQKEIEPNIEELMDEVINILRNVDIEHRKHLGCEEEYGRFIIDGFPSDNEYWMYLSNSNLLPDFTVALIENKEVDSDLAQAYINRGSCSKNYPQFFLACDELMKVKLQHKQVENKEALIAKSDVEAILNIILDCISIDKTEILKTLTESVEKFREEWDNLKIKLEENFTTHFDVQIEDKTDIQIIDEVLQKLRNSCGIFSNSIDGEDINVEDNENTSSNDSHENNESRFLCETKTYCPIAYYCYGVLWEGKPEYCLKCENKLHYFCKQECLEKFQNDITKYQAYNIPFKELPPLRICVMGCIGSGKTTIAKLLAKEYGLIHVNFAEAVNRYLLPRHFKNVGRQFHNALTDTIIDEEFVTEFNMNEEDSNFQFKILENENELRYMIYNYLEKGTPMLSFLLQKLIKKIWFEPPFSTTGFVLDGYPKMASDVEDMVQCFCIPDIIIDLEGSSEESVQRLSPKMLDMWRAERNEAKNNAKIKFELERQQWLNFVTKHVVIKLIVDEIIESIVIIPQGVVKSLSTQSTIIDADPLGSSNVDANLFRIYNSIIDEYPEPTDQSMWEKIEDAREKIESKIEVTYEIDDENIQSLKDVLFEQKIKILSIDVTKSLTKVQKHVLSKVSYLRIKRESCLENTFVLSHDIAEILLKEGFYFLSMFYRMCPVFIHENPNTIFHSYNLSKTKNKIIPVVYRAHIYFISNEDNLKKFRQNPLTYIRSELLHSHVEYPLKIGIIGPPKSGKSELTAKLAKKYDLLSVSKGIAIRYILNHMPWTDLSSKIKSELREGKCITNDLIMQCVQTVVINYCTATRGFILDGIPETPFEAAELMKMGLNPLIIFDFRVFGESVIQNSQNEIYFDIIKMKPPYSRNFFTYRNLKYNEKCDRIREFLENDSQNLFILDGSKSRWQCFYNADFKIHNIIPEIHFYLTNVKAKVVPAGVMCISNHVFESKMSEFRNLCPICLSKNVLRHSNYPVDKKGVVQFKDCFYWVCSEHMNSVLKCPEKFLTQKLNIPEIPAVVKSINPICLFENGICVVTYAENLPAQQIVKASRVPVPDERFDYLCEFHKPASKVPAFLNVVDIAGLVRGAAEGQGLGNAFLSHIKACDAIFNLCRAFDDEDVIHVDGDVNPVRDLETIGEELRLKDVEQLLQNIEKLDRVVNRGNDKKLKPEYDALLKIKTILEDEKKHIRFGDWSASEIEVLNKYLFLTSKPALYLVNLSEKDYIRKKNKWLPKLKEWIDKNDPGAPLIPFSGVLESKLLDMDAAEKQAFLKENNVTSALDKIIVQGYKALQLEYFFTAGPDEVKAWTIQKGTKAPQAAGRIHTDFEKGFIMAEVMHFKDFKEEGTEAACKAAGKYRQQGRNYVVEDGDIIFFKFNAGAGLKDAKKK